MRKLLLVGIVVLQLAFIIVISLTNLFINTAMFDDIMTIQNTLDKANYNATSIQNNGEFIQNYLPLMEAFRSFKVNLTKLLVYNILLFLLFQGPIWSFVHYYIKKQNIGKLLARFMLMSAVIGGILIILLYLIGSWMLNRAIEYGELSGFAVIYIILGLGFYALTMGYLSIDKSSIWKKFKKPHITLTMFLGYILGMIVIAALMYYINHIVLTTILLLVLSVYLGFGKIGMKMLTQDL